MLFQKTCWPSDGCIFSENISNLNYMHIRGFFATQCKSCGK